MDRSSGENNYIVDGSLVWSIGCFETSTASPHHVVFGVLLHLLSLPGMRFDVQCTDGVIQMLHTTAIVSGVTLHAFVYMKETRLACLFDFSQTIRYCS